MTNSRSTSPPSTDTEVDDIHVTVDLTTETIPFVDMDAVHEPYRDQIREAVDAVLGRGDFILGPGVDRFETEFAAYVGVSHAIGVDSGFSALELLLRAHGVGRGDEVVTVANTFYATAMAIRATGATPVLVDSDPSTHLLNPEAVAGAMSGRTRAIIPVHLYGRRAPMTEISRLAARYDVAVIEDACQAHGAGDRPRRAGALGNGGAFSFYPSKNLGALGDGGMVTVDDEVLARRVRMLRNLGSAERYRHEEPGFNRRLDTIHAVALSVKLAHLDRDNDQRRSIARTYNELLAGLPVATPEVTDDHVFHLYVIETDRRDDLAEHLRSEGIASGIHYPTPIHLQPAFTDLGWRQGQFPRAERSAGRILSLPMYPRMRQRDTERVAHAVRRFFS